MESLSVDKDIRKLILDNEVFWVRVSSSLAILEPIASAIQEIEKDDAVLSDVPRLFAGLKQKITVALPSSPLLQSEEASVTTYIENRMQFCIKPIHAAANILDPVRQGQDIDEEQVGSAYSVISAMVIHMNLDVGEVMGSLAKFRAKDGIWKSDGVWKSADHVSKATWWKGLCSSEPVSSIASILSQIPPTSASSERNWSMYGNTHTKLRNRLTNDRVEKLVAIRSNLKLFEDDIGEDNLTICTSEMDSDSEVMEDSVLSDSEEA